MLHELNHDVERPLPPLVSKLAGSFSFFMFAWTLLTVYSTLNHGVLEGRLTSDPSKQIKVSIGYYCSTIDYVMSRMARLFLNNNEQT